MANKNSSSLESTESQETSPVVSLEALEKLPIPARIKNFFRTPTFTKIAIPVTFLLLSIGGYFGYQHWNFLHLAPTVVAGNFSLEYKKVPYNIPSIDIIFSHDLNGSSVTANSVKIYPFVSGTPSLKNPKTVSYTLAGPLEIGKKYLLQFTTDITSAQGTKLASEITYEIEAIGGVEVMKMIPNAETEALSKNPLFIFNIPVVPASTLEEREKLPCPVRFSPELPGKCTWPSGNILEYKITGNLEASTEYKTKIELGSEFLFPLAKPFESSFKTIALRVLTGSLDESNFQRFSPKDGIPLTLTAPVLISDLSKAIVLKNEAGVVIPHKVVATNSGATSSHLFVTGENGSLPFASNFTLTLSGGLMPTPGNIPLKESITLSAKSNGFISYTNFSQVDEWSSTGAEINSRDLTYYGKIPPISPRIELTLDEPVDLAALGTKAIEAIRLEAKNGGKKYLCVLSQPQELMAESEDSLKRVMKPVLQRLRCQFTETLPLGTDFDLVFDTTLSPGLREALRVPYSTPPEFVVKDVVMKSATEMCVYSTSSIQYSGSGITFSPKGRVKEVTENFYENDGKNRICEEKEGLTVNVLEARLDGNTVYDMELNGSLKNVYGMPLSKNFVKKQFTTPPLKKQDEYLYFMPSKDVQVIPLDAPIVLPLQTINLDSAYIRVCSLTPESYAAYLRNRYENSYVPDCASTVTRKVNLKNGKWNLTTSKIDLATDVLEAPLPGNILLVQGSADEKVWTHEWPEQRDFSVIYERTNLSLMMENSGSGSIIFATDFDGKNIPNDLNFEAFGCDTPNSSSGIKIAKFNAQKNIYELNSALLNVSYCRVITATNSQYYGLIVPGNDSTSNYDFGQFGGADTSDREYVYLHTDRPIYRAGDSVYFQGILRTFAATGYVKSSAKQVKIRVLNNESQLFKEVVVDVDERSNFEGTLNLTTEMKTGRYSFEVLAYNAKGDVEKNASLGYYVINDGNFYVEQYSKPVFKTEVSGGKRDLVPGEKIEAVATASYYFGGKVSNAPVKWTINGQDYYFDPKGYSEYRFGTDESLVQCRYWGSCSTHDQFLGTSSKTLDGAGTSTISYTAELQKNEEVQGEKQVGTPDAPKERLVTMTAEVQDPNTGKTISGSDSHVVHVTDGYVGINTPYWVDKNAKISVNGVTLGLDSNPKKASVKLELIRTEWNSVKKLGVDGVYYNEYELAKTLESTEEVTSSKDGKFTSELTPKQGGEYVVRASYTGENKQTYVSDSYSYVASDTYSMWNTGNNSVTELTAEKSILNPGETAVFTLKSPITHGKIFYSVEKDDQILSSKVIDITGYGQKIEIPVLASYIPNVYIRAFIIGRDDPKGLPVYKRALAQIRVLPDSKKLSIEVTPEQSTYLPGETLKVNIAVKDATGKPIPGAIGALSVVDESVLALLGNPEKNPFAFFYEMKRYLGTTISVSLMNLVEKLEVKSAASGEKGGAGEGNKGGDTKKKRGVFKDTAFWNSKFATNAEGRVTIDTGKLPDNLTTWKIEAVISTDDTKIGVGRASITTEQKVMIQENFPRFLRTGDHTDFSPVVFNRTGKRQRFVVEMTGTGVDVTNAKQEIALDNGESSPVTFVVVAKPLPVEKTNGPVDIAVTAVAESGEQDGIQKTLTVNRGETYETTSYIGVASGNSLDESLNLTGVAQGATLTLNTSPTLLGNVLTGLENMLAYPYGCIEQITSAMIPHIAVKQIHDALGVPYDLKQKTLSYYDVTSGAWVARSIADIMGDYIVRVMAYSLPNGGFGYWKNAEYAEFELTAYAMNTLSQIQTLGIPVDQNLSKSAIGYLKARLAAGVREGCAGSESECSYSFHEKLSAVGAIALWSTDGVDALKAYKALGTPKSSLADTLDRLQVISTLLGKKGIADVEKTTLKASAKGEIDTIQATFLVYDPRGAYLAPDFGTSRVDATAKFIGVLATLGEDTDANRQILDNMSRFLARMKKSDGSYGSTLETASVLQAFAARTSHDSEIKKTSFDARATLGGKEVYHEAFDVSKLLATSVSNVSLSGLSNSEVLNVSTNGIGRLYYDMTLRYPIVADKVDARDEGFFVTTNYYDYLEYQKIEQTKAKEFEEYLAGKKLYSELKYPKDVSEYIQPITRAKVGQLVRVQYRVILSETRDKVAFESFIPAGSELINTVLKTETKTVNKDTFFDREDLMDDRYFAYSNVLESGEYSGSYAIRFTHGGEFMIPSTRVVEFYTPEVFGQTRGGVIEVGK